MPLMTSVRDDMTPLLERMRSGYGAAREGLIRMLAESLQEQLHMVAPVGQHYGLGGSQQAGGTLRDSLFFRVGPDGATLLGASHGLYVIGGTQPHPIRARNARALRFWWVKKGGPFVGPSVQHPGNAPNDFRLTALANVFANGTVERAAARFWQTMQGG